MKTMQVQAALPNMAIAVKEQNTKNQLPVHNGASYLRDGQEFMLMMHNPTSKVIAAKLYFNGKAQANAIRLRPGERVWLDRFVDVDKKLKFDTYFVENSDESKHAIAGNGKVRVEFFEQAETVIPPPINYPNWPVIRPIFIDRPVYPYIHPYTMPSPYWQPGIFYSSGIPGNIGGCNANYAAGVTTSSYNSTGVIGNNGSSGSAGESHVTMDSMQEFSDELETGRIEAGEKSKQELKESYDEFKPNYFHSIEIELLPESRKPVSAKDLRPKCAKCNRKQKKKEIFCPSCGTKF